MGETWADGEMSLCSLTERLCRVAKGQETVFLLLVIVVCKELGGAGLCSSPHGLGHPSISHSWSHSRIQADGVVGSRRNIPLSRHRGVQPTAHGMAMNAAQHIIVNLLKTL